MSSIQAILFNRDYFNQRQATAWLKRNNLHKIKPYHITNKFIRARLLQPDYNHYYYRTGTLQRGVNCIWEFALK